MWRPGLEPRAKRWTFGPTAKQAPRRALRSMRSLSIWRKLATEGGDGGGAGFEGGVDVEVEVGAEHAAEAVHGGPAHCAVVTIQRVQQERGIDAQAGDLGVGDGLAADQEAVDQEVLFGAEAGAVEALEDVGGVAADARELVEGGPADAIVAVVEPGQQGV